MTVESTISKLGGKSFTFLGFPISWFEKCENYLIADGVVNQDGSLGFPDHSGYCICFRMSYRFRIKAGWHNLT